MTSSLSSPNGPAITGSTGGLVAEYSTAGGAYDELLDGNNAVRPHWRPLIEQLDAMSPDELLRHWEEARRLLHENGVTHNVYGALDGVDRPWNLDFVPMPLPPEQWRAIEVGLAQRATLLNLLLADLYGRNRAIEEGVLPAQLLLANPAYLRPCHNVTPPGNVWLQLYAADLARGDDGRFVVLSDRTQAPSGSGYALENRIVLSRVLGKAFRACHVHRLAPFFIALRQQLASIAPSNRDNPRIVLLTPGPYNETYFEHVYLARYLGYTLVQGNDLTVRDRTVYLKTLGGLQRVDVILRRVDDDFCDPLELYARSFLGVPGLLESVRAGRVAIANALGTGLLQAPAIMAFLPKLCRYFLGQDLILPSVTTHWAGDPTSAKYVRENIDRLVIKPAFTARGSPPVFGDALTSEQREHWLTRLAERPNDFVAQENTRPSTVPVLLDQQVQRRHLVLRTFLCSSGDSYLAMPGGLTRVAAAPDSWVVSLQHGGGSKDTWVLADGDVGDATLLAPRTGAIPLQRGGGDLPSRVADDLFWVGRYVERAEATVRLARVAFGRLNDQLGFETTTVLDVLAHALTGKPIKPGARHEPELLAVLLDTERPAGLRKALIALHDLARAVRDRISGDAWRILQTIDEACDRFAPPRRFEPLAGVLELLNGLVINLAAFDGMVADSMTREQAWQFLDIGRRIERGLGIARLLRSTLVDVSAVEPPVLESVLEVADSSLTYRRRYLTQLHAAAVSDLLLADETNPRSVAYQLAALEEHLSKLPREGTHPQSSQDLLRVIRLRTDVRLTDCNADCIATAGRREKLDRLLAAIESGLIGVSDELRHTYFTHASSARGMSVVGPEGMI